MAVSDRAAAALGDGEVGEAARRRRRSPRRYRPAPAAAPRAQARRSAVERSLALRRRSRRPAPSLRTQPAHARLARQPPDVGPEADALNQAGDADARTAIRRIGRTAVSWLTPSRPRSSHARASPPCPRRVVAETRITSMARIDAPGVLDGLLDVEVEVGQQVALVEQHQVGGAEHVGILERLVLALGDREDHHLVRLAEIEGGRADEVADVLDQQQRVARAAAAARRAWPTMWASRWQPLPVLIWIAGAPVARMRSASLAGLLVALDHRDRALALRAPRWSCTSSVVLPEPGLDTRFSAKMPRPARTARFCARIGVVLGQDVLLDLHHARRRRARVHGRARERRRSHATASWAWS